MDGYSSVTTARRFVVGVVLLASLGGLLLTSQGSAAQVATVDVAADLGAAVDNTVPSPTPGTDELMARIAVLEQQLALTRQSGLLTEERMGRQRDTILAMQDAENNFMSPLSVEYQERAMDAWRAGYRIGGGSHLAEFENTILPCESGNEVDPFSAVSRTDDWGRAQINRRTWRIHFSELTGLAFEEWILDPTMNGYMAGVVEQQQGLRAWTCWRRR